MSTHISSLIQYLKSLLPAASVPDVLASLHQDRIVWKELLNSEFLNEVCSRISAQENVQLTHWSPARLALAALNQPYNAGNTLEQMPVTFLEQITRGYPNLIRNQEEQDLTRSGAIALALADRYRRIGSWSFLPDEIDQHATFPWETAMACLLGMVDEPQKFLAALASQQPSLLRSRLAVHAILSHPSESGSRIDLLTAITGRSLGNFPTLPLDMLDLLQILNHQSPYLASAFCRKINAQKTSTSHLPVSQPFHQTDILRETAGTLLELEIARLAGDQVQHDLNLEKLIAMRNLLAATLLAQAATMRPVNTSDPMTSAHLISNWKKTIELVQSVQPAAIIDPFKAGYALALTQIDNSSEAHSILSRGKFGNSDDPYQVHAVLITAHKNGDDQLARQAGEHLTQIVNRDLQAHGYIAPHAAIDPAQIAGDLHSLDMPSEAMSVLENALQQSPNQEIWRKKLIEFQIDSSRYIEAAENMQFLAGLHPEDLHLRHQLAKTHEANQNWSAALDEWTALIEETHYTSQQEELDDLHALASCALKAGKAEAAIHASKRAISLFNDNGLAYALLGRAYTMQHDFTHGMEYVTQATQINPNLPEGWLALADLLTQQGQTLQAIDSLQTANQIIPNNPQLLCAIGELHLSAGNPTLAADVLKKAVMVDPTQVHYHYTLGLSLSRLGHNADAIQELFHAYKADNQNIKYASAYGAVLLDAGDSQAALEPLTIATQSKEYATPEAYINYARAVLALHQEGTPDPEPGLALKAIEAALALAPELPEIQGWYAEVLRATDNLGAAFTTYQQALETQLSNDRYWREKLSYGLGLTAYQLGRYDIAIASAQEAISIAPHDAQNYKLIADAYLNSGLFEESLRAARTVLNLNIDNLTNLAWYADQIICLITHNNALTSSGLQNQARQAMHEAQNALQQAVQLAPSRADLLVKLSKLQQMAGNTQSALDTVKLVLGNKDASVEQLTSAADQMLSLGDLKGTITFLEKAVAISQPGSGTNPQLLARLANAYTVVGDLTSASDTLEQAISIAPNIGSLYYERTNLLLNLGRTEDAFACVETGISLARTDSSLPRLYILAACLYRLNGDLASALGYIRNGLEEYKHLEASQSSDTPTLSLEDRLLVADLYRASLQPLKAHQALKDEPDFKEIGDSRITGTYLDWIGLKIELELELNYTPDVHHIEHIQAHVSSPTSRWLAVLTRLALRTGTQELATEYYRSAIRIAQKENADKISQAGLSRIASRRSMISLLEAAFDFQDWLMVQDLVGRLLEIVPDEPFTHLAYVRSLVGQAEFQQVCERLEVQKHAPGSEALASDRKENLENAIQQLSNLIHSIDKNHPAYDLAHPVTRMERWHSRAQIAFTQNPAENSDPSLLSAAIARLRINPSELAQTGEEAAAVIASTLKNIRQGSDDNLLTEILYLARPHSRNPWVWLHAALALERDYPREAFSAARGAIQLFTCKQSPSAVLDNALLARIALRLNDLATAQEAIELALKVWTDEPYWHVLAAQIYQANQQPGEERKHLEQAAQIEPTATAIQLELGKAYLAENAPDSANVLKAMQCFETAVHLDNGDVSSWIWLARAQLRARQVDQAEKSVNQLIALAPDDAEAAILQAEIALQKKSYQAAHSFAQSAVQSSPEDPKTTLLLARTLKSLNRPAEALQVIESALPITRDPFQLQYERAKLLHELHGPEAALQVLTGLVATYPDDASILTSLARSQADLGDIQAATQTALAALKVGKLGMEPDALAGVHFLAGTLLRRSGQLDQAIQHLNEAVSLAPEHLEAYLELGLARKERREYQQALLAFEQAVKIAPHDHRPHYQAGLALKEGKDYRRSEVMLRQAAHLAPDDVMVRRQLAQVVALNVVHNPRT